MPSTTDFSHEFSASSAGPEASHMPNKTIYVADSDLPIFERAQELAGENLSATIAGALRRYVKAEEARAAGYVEVSLKVGSHDTFTVKRFMGRELARRRDRDAESQRILKQIVFQTAKGRFVLFSHYSPDWTVWSDLGNWGGDWDIDVDVDVSKGSWRVRTGDKQKGGGGRWGGRDWSVWVEGDERALFVYETLDDLNPHIAPELAAAVANALHGDEEEYLDI